MFKKISTIFLTCMAGCLLFAPVSYAAGSYKVMQPDGTVLDVEDENTDVIINNIRSVSGDKAADAYIDAMASGDYREFYIISGNNKETALVPEYMQVDGLDYTNNPLTNAQTLESDVWTLIGSDGTVQKAGEAAKEAGFAATQDGLFEYYMAIVDGKAKRPSYAKDPVYRLVEMGGDFRTIEEVDLFYNKHILVEYEDEPLTDFQKQIAEQNGLTIKKASELKAEGLLEKIEDGSSEIVTEVPKEESKEVTENKPAFNLTATQFILIAVIVILLTSLITAGIRSVVVKNK